MKKLLILLICLLPLAASAGPAKMKPAKRRAGKFGARHNVLPGHTISKAGLRYVHRKVHSAEEHTIKGRSPGGVAAAQQKVQYRPLLGLMVKSAALRDWKIRNIFPRGGSMPDEKVQEIIDHSPKVTQNRSISPKVLEAVHIFRELPESKIPLLEQQFWRFILSDLISGENEFAVEKTPGLRADGKNFSIVLQQDVRVIVYDVKKGEAPSQVKLLPKGTELMWDHSLRTGEANYGTCKTHVKDENRLTERFMRESPQKFGLWRERMLNSASFTQTDMVPDVKDAANLLFSSEGQEFFGEPIWVNSLHTSGLSPFIYVPIIKPFTIVKGSQIERYELGSYVRIDAGFSQLDRLKTMPYFRKGKETSEVGAFELSYIAEVLDGGDKTDVIEREEFFERVSSGYGAEIFVPKHNILVYENFIPSFVLTPKNKLIMKEGLLVEITGPKPTRDKFLQDQIPAEFVNEKSTVQPSETFVGETTVEKMSNWWLGLSEKQRQEVVARAQAEAAENGWQQPTTVKDFYWSNEAYKANKAKQAQAQQPVIDTQEVTTPEATSLDPEEIVLTEDPAQIALIKMERTAYAWWEGLSNEEQAAAIARAYDIAAKLGLETPQNHVDYYNVLQRADKLPKTEQDLSPDEQAGMYGYSDLSSRKEEPIETPKTSSPSADPEMEAFIKRFNEMSPVDMATLMAEVAAIAAELKKDMPQDAAGYYRLLKKGKVLKKYLRDEWEKNLTKTQRAFYGLPLTKSQSPNKTHDRRGGPKRKRRGDNSGGYFGRRAQQLTPVVAETVNVKEKLAAYDIDPQSVGEEERFVFKHAPYEKRNYQYQMVQVKTPITLNGKEVPSGSYLDFTSTPGKVLVRQEDDVKRGFKTPKK